MKVLPKKIELSTEDIKKAIHMFLKDMGHMGSYEISFSANDEYIIGDDGHGSTANTVVEALAVEVENDPDTNHIRLE